jgi:hypothetical protein
MTAAEDVAQPNSRNLMGLVIVDGCNVRTKTHVLRGVAVKRRENLWFERQETTQASHLGTHTVAGSPPLGIS